MIVTSKMKSPQIIADKEVNTISKVTNRNEKLFVLPYVLMCLSRAPTHLSFELRSVRGEVGHGEKSVGSMAVLVVVMHRKFPMVPNGNESTCRLTQLPG